MDALESFKSVSDENKSCSKVIPSNEWLIIFIFPHQLSKSYLSLRNNFEPMIVKEPSDVLLVLKRLVTDLEQVDSRIVDKLFHSIHYTLGVMLYYKKIFYWNNTQATYEKKPTL